MRRRFDHPFDVTHHIAIGEPDHAIPFALEEARAIGVTAHRVGVGVAVDLDDQPGAMRAEVGVVRAERNLEAESQAREGFTQGTP